MKQKIRHLTQSAVIAAAYVVLTMMQNLLLPDSTSWGVQFRASEALCVLALFTPAAIPGLTLGCLLFNLTYAGALPLDFLVGSLATLLATEGMWLLRRRWKLALLLPALTNGLLVGWELSVYVGGAFWLQALYVAAGEAAVLLTLGSVLYWVIRTRHLDARLFGSTGR